MDKFSASYIVWLADQAESLSQHETLAEAEKALENHLEKHASNPPVVLQIDGDGYVVQEFKAEELIENIQEWDLKAMDREAASFIENLYEDDLFVDDFFNG